MFSVVIPLYNKELSIQNTIKSVLQQSFQEFEIVVVNDGSTDASVARVEEIDDSRIRLVHQKNQGVSAARNKGVAEAKFSWIAFLDGDDFWEPNHLEEITKMMELYPEEKVFVTSFVYSDNRPMFKHPRAIPIFKIENYFKEALKESLMWTSIVVVNNNCFEVVGGFNEQLRYGEDLDLWARLAKEYQVVKSSKVTAIYRVEAENRSNNNQKIEHCFEYWIELNRVTNDAQQQYYCRLILSKLNDLIRARNKAAFSGLYNRHESLTVFSLFAFMLKLYTNKALSRLL